MTTRKEQEIPQSMQQDPEVLQVQYILELNRLSLATKTIPKTPEVIEICKHGALLIKESEESKEHNLYLGQVRDKQDYQELRFFVCPAGTENDEDTKDIVIDTYGGEEPVATYIRDMFKISNHTELNRLVQTAIGQKKLSRHIRPHQHDINNTLSTPNT